jgi:hypothetical protein
VSSPPRRVRSLLRVPSCDLLRRFVRAYARVIPRHAFVELLESCMAVGLTTIVTSVIELLFEWAVTAEIRKQCDQQE